MREGVEGYSSRWAVWGCAPVKNFATADGYIAYFLCKI
jgi:hypothetical protein